MSTIDVSGLEPDAVRVVELIVERLRLGQRQYGPLDLATNPRDWRREASEELLDAIAYLAMATLKERSPHGHRCVCANCFANKMQAKE